MTKTEKVNFVIKTLKDFYPKIPIPLDHKDPYTLLIAVLLSAQCTDVRVNKITPILFAKADNPYDMVKLSVEDIREIIRPVGLSPMKSKGIHGLSEILVKKSVKNINEAIGHINKYGTMHTDAIITNNLKSANMLTSYPGPKYKKVSFSNPGHAHNLAKKLNDLFSCKEFSVVKLTAGESVPLEN